MKKSHFSRVFLSAVVAAGLIFWVSGAEYALAARGSKGKPGGGSDGGSTQILPVNLGTPADCGSSYGNGINTNVGFGLYVVAQGGSCSSPSRIAALRWTQSDGMLNIGTLPGSSGASAEGVSDDGTVVGWTGGDVGLPFVFPPGSVSVAALPILAGMRWGAADGISADGRFIVGTNSTEQVFLPVRWTRSGQGWNPTALNVTDVIGPGTTPAVSNDGTALVNRAIPSGGSGARVGRAGYWAAGSTAWIALPGDYTRAYGISVSGDWIVGERLAPCSANCSRYPVPVYWKKQGTGWLGPFDLPALDDVDSRAYAVADRNGRKVIVGHGFTKKDAIKRAVYWLEQPDGTFTLNRLAGLDGRGRAPASAEDINDAGQIVGTSAGTGSDMFTVMWTLP